ncbi:MAG TPA: sialate O-acetylesterase [Luteolibacter sp.]|nr:sialate O-acetylesterase [Luteolibacter sp.]
MKISSFQKAVAAVALGLLCNAAGSAHAAPATLQLAKLFSDHMVLQQEKPIHIWGFDAPGSDVMVALNGQSQQATSDKEGSWRVTLPAMKADGKKHTVTVKGSTTLTLQNVVLGEVWICSGQSNMEWGSGPELCAEAKHPDLRLFCAGNRALPLKADLILPTGWAECQPDTLELGGSKIFDSKAGSIKRVKSFSRIGYQFGRDLHQELGVPVGMIKASLGGSRVISWTPHESCEREFPFGKEMTINENVIKRQPGALYHLLVQPLTQLSVRGVIWFQGENDADNPEYEKQLEQMITGWRAAFGNPSMPFSMVQMSPNSFHDGMLGVWEGQRHVVAKLPNCSIVHTNDIYGEKHRSVDPETSWPLQGQLDPHPGNHPLIARRLLDLCLQKTYGKEGPEARGPMVQSHRIEGNKILITFDHVGEGLKSADGEALNWFEVSDGSRKDGTGPYLYAKAEARVIGKNQIEVHSPAVAAPKYVRFSWHMYARNNLVNSTGLPGFAFRTDDHKNPKER